MKLVGSDHALSPAEPSARTWNQWTPHANVVDVHRRSAPSTNAPASTGESSLPGVTITWKRCGAQPRWLHSRVGVRDPVSLPSAGAVFVGVGGRHGGVVVVVGRVVVVGGVVVVVGPVVGGSVDVGARVLDVVAPLVDVSVVDVSPAANSLVDVEPSSGAARSDGRVVVVAGCSASEPTRILATAGPLVWPPPSLPTTRRSKVPGPAGVHDSSTLTSA